MERREREKPRSIWERDRDRERDDRTRTTIVRSIPPAVDLTICDRRSMAYLDMPFDSHNFYYGETWSW